MWPPPLLACRERGNMCRDGRPVNGRCLCHYGQPCGMLPLLVGGAQDLGAHADDLDRLLGQDVVDQLVPVGVEEGPLPIPAAPVRLHNAHE